MVEGGGWGEGGGGLGCWCLLGLVVEGLKCCWWCCKFGVVRQNNRNLKGEGERRGKSGLVSAGDSKRSGRGDHGSYRARTLLNFDVNLGEMSSLPFVRQSSSK